MIQNFLHSFLGLLQFIVCSLYHNAGTVEKKYGKERKKTQQNRKCHRLGLTETINGR